MKASIRTPQLSWGLLAAVSTAAAISAAPAWAQNTARDLVVTPQQRSTAQQVAQRGIPVAELAANAPDQYTVKRGDTLWAISGLYLKRQWRWPELWGMNLEKIPNPHLIYPGQILYLDKTNGYARLGTTPPGGVETIRVTPSVRSESLSDVALPTLNPRLIEPFLVEPVVLQKGELEAAPRIVAGGDQRAIMGSGDVVYATGGPNTPLDTQADRAVRNYQLYRKATPMIDPVTREVLGYEAQFVGKAYLDKSENTVETTNSKGELVAQYRPATVKLLDARQEVVAGDRMLPAPSRSFLSYTPRAPKVDVNARVVSLYGSDSLKYAAQNQVVAINRGEQDGIQSGDVLALLTTGERVLDKGAPGKTWVQLPNERNGLAMVFRTFDRVSYALILEIHNGVVVGDQLINP